MIKLTPNKYKQNIQISMLSSNKIDTVALHPISNVAAENRVFHTEKVNVVTLNNAQQQLPIDSHVQPTHYHTSSNTTWGNIVVGTELFAKARIECVLASGKTRCTAESVIQGDPTVNIRLECQSQRVARGGGTFSSYPAAESLNLPSWSLASWIAENKTETSDSPFFDYAGSHLALNPWVRNFVPFDSSDNDPSANDVITDWTSGNSSRIGLWWQNWSENSNLNLNQYPLVRMQSPNTVGGDLEMTAGKTLSLHNISIAMTRAVTRLDDHNYEVTWTVPIRVSYAAASRDFGVFGGEYDVDNFAFTDLVTDIIIELSGTPFSTDIQDVSYGLDKNDELITTVTNTFPIDINAEEALTSATYYGTKDKNVFSYEGAVTGVCLTSGGALSTNGQSFVTDYMWFNKGDILIAPAYTQSSIVGCKYDESKNVIGDLTGGISGNIVAYMMSADQYVRLNGNVSDYTAGIYYVTRRANYLWIEAISEQLLRKYRDGKLSVACTVSAAWAMQNNITVGTQMTVKLLDGKMVTRKGVTSTFAVKNIEKRYTANEFVYDLTLLEV